MEFLWNEDKNRSLKEDRGISFDEIVRIIQSGGLVADVPHPDKLKYPEQRVMYVDVSGYIYIVPYVRDGENLFLKTIYPSRKATKEIKWRAK
ncbi:MAG TPA: toxin [bacterium]|mgnify:CR=1 FL=1|nr:toxin [bacterium]HPS29611.1 toxin [bacterium]